MNLKDALKKAARLDAIEDAKIGWMTDENKMNLLAFLIAWEKKFGIKVDESIVLASLFIQTGLYMAAQMTEANLPTKNPLPAEHESEGTIH